MEYYDDDGLPDAAFTQTELDADIKSLFEEESYHGGIESIDPEEILSEVSREQVITDLFNEAINDYDNDITVETYLEFSNGAVLNGLGVIERASLKDRSIDYYYLKFKPQCSPDGHHGPNEYCVSLRMLLTTLKETHLPARIEGYWIAWDASKEQPVLSFGVNYKRTRIYGLVSPCFSSFIVENEDPRLRALLNKSLLSMEHGFKPMVIKRKDLPSLKNFEQVEVINPANITTNDIHDYFLAFFNRRGEIKYYSLASVANNETILSTRAGTFTYHSGAFIPTFDYPIMLANAYRLAGIEHNRNLKYFLCKPKCSIYESSIQAITENEATKTRKSEKIYLTDGRHPLDINNHTGMRREGCLATTLYLYANAIIMSRSYA